MRSRDGVDGTHMRNGATRKEAGRLKKSATAANTQRPCEREARFNSATLDQLTDEQYARLGPRQLDELADDQ